MKISIITPNFNGSDFLEDTILSVLDQNYQDLEYIIIDGGSTDGSIEIIKKYEKHLAYWVSEPDNGIYHAIQKGFDKSTGEIMTWINSDDMYHRNAFHTVAEIFSSFEQVNWLVGASTFYDESGRTVLCNHSRIFTKFDFFNHDFKWIQQESVFWRRILWLKTGSNLNLQYKYAGDLELWLRFFEFEKLFVTHALIGGFRMRNKNQLSLDHIEDYLNEADLAINKTVLSENDRKILTDYRKLLKIVAYIKKVKYLRTDWIIQRYRSKYFDQPSELHFDRSIMRFVLPV